MGVTEGGCWGVESGVLVGVGWEGRKEMESVPEKRTTETERAMGRTAVRGFG